MEILNPIFNEANCRQLGLEAVSLLYPEFGDERAEAIGRSVCSGCIAFEACDELGMKRELHNDGIFGGLTRHERENRHKAVVREQRRRNGR